MITLTSTVPDAIRKLIRDCQTEDNWDDENATGITAEACEAAIQFLGSVMQHDAEISMPDVSPSVYGSVTLHWQSGGKHLIVRPSSDPGSAYFRYEDPAKDSISGHESQEQVVQRVLKFLCSTNAE